MYVIYISICQQNHGSQQVVERLGTQKPVPVFDPGAMSVLFGFRVVFLTPHGWFTVTVTNYVPITIMVMTNIAMENPS